MAARALVKDVLVTVAMEGVGGAVEGAIEQLPFGPVMLRLKGKISAACDAASDNDSTVHDALRQATNLCASLESLQTSKQINTSAQSSCQDTVDVVQTLLQAAHEWQATKGIRRTFKAKAKKDELTAQLARLRTCVQDLTLALDVNNNQKLDRLAAREARRLTAIDYSELQFVKLLGEGSFGCVWLALWNNHYVAAKRLRVGHESNSELLAKLKHEAQLIASVPHTNVIQLFGISSHGQSETCLVMECGDCSLFDYVHTERNDEPIEALLATSMVGDVMAALKHMHTHNIAHRDLNPRNIILWRRTLVVKVSDFGEGKVVAETAHRGGSTTGRAVGTAQWMSPEMMRRSVGARIDFFKCDIFSVGIILIELLSGQIPWADCVNDMQVKDAVADQGLRPPLPEGTPDVLREIAHDATRQDPNERPFADSLSGRVHEALGILGGDPRPTQAAGGSTAGGGFPMEVFLPPAPPQFPHDIMAWVKRLDLTPEREHKLLEVLTGDDVGATVLQEVADLESHDLNMIKKSLPSAKRGVFQREVDQLKEAAGHQVPTSPSAADQARQQLETKGTTPKLDKLRLGRNALDVQIKADVDAGDNGRREAVANTGAEGKETATAAAAEATEEQAGRHAGAAAEAPRAPNAKATEEQSGSKHERRQRALIWPFGRSKRNASAKLGSPRKVNKRLDKQILEAAKSKGLAEVADLLSRGADLKAKYQNGWTPLHLAAYFNSNVEVLRALLEAGADIYARSKNGSTPLILAARFNSNVEVLRALLEAGAFIHAKDKDGSTPLMHGALNNSNVAVLQALLEAGADINATNNEGSMPLHWAARHKSTVEVVQALLKAGANINAKDKNRDTPLHLAARGNSKMEVLRALLEAGADINTKDKGGATPLCLAAKEKREDIVAMLVAKGAIDNSLDSAICDAAGNGEIAEVHNLLARGANPNVMAKDGSTPLHRATGKNANAELVQMLLDAGAKVAAHDKEGNTPLLFAAWRKAKVDVVQALLRAGADANAKNKDGNTPLLFAASGTAKVDVVQALLEASADVNARNKHGNTPLLYATRHNSSAEVVHALLGAGADFNQTDKFGSTPLHCATESNATAEVVQALLDAGANATAHDKDGNTPVHLTAAHNSNAKVLQILLGAGADVNAKNKDGKTPLFFAVEHTPNVEVLRALLEAGSDDHAKNEALLDAVRKGQLEAAQALVEAGVDGNKALWAQFMAPQLRDICVVLRGLQCLQPGDPLVTALEAWCLNFGRGDFPKDEQAARNLFEQVDVAVLRARAEQDNPHAAFLLGFMLDTGMGVTQDQAAAAQLYAGAAAQGHAPAQCSLGICYELGQGMPRRPRTAWRWYSKAAEQGYAAAQCNLGYCYEDGQGVTRNYANAVKWYSKAAEQGLARAQCNLGYCYEHGQSVTQNSATAVEWYSKAAEQGEAAAQHNLGLCYEHGSGVAKDLTAAMKWFRKAAEQGSAKAQTSLQRLGQQ